MTPTLVCALACLVLVFAEYRALVRLRFVAKLVASAAFVVLAAPAWGASTFATWIVAGLVLGALGDAALLGHGKRWFLAGLVAFLAGHLAYVAAFAELVTPSRWPAEAGLLAIAPIVVGAGVLAYLWPRLGSLRVPVVLYVAVIVAMVIGALAVHHAGALPDPARTRLLAGALLFFVSDLAVARDRFVVRAFSNKAWGLPAYYAGQLAIAWSLL